ncbi:MAG: hypothetical protein J0I14_01515 [Propionibacteriaceae bacterium]|nr:hypothetical protein [Propionibacteriaceae bacterium]
MAHDVEVLRVLCFTNAIESLNARFRRAGRGPGPLPNPASRDEDPCICSLDHCAPRAPVRHDGLRGRSPALNAYAITFADGMPATTENRQR